MTDYLKVVRRKPLKESETQKRARERVEEFYKNHPDNPFINVAAIMKRMIREREGGFVLDNSHRRPGG
ncbi:MAG: hypothetical protein DRH04_05860 [Deltaproteobacteria bacterium]|nr:MAG: hypothetical protein DRH04_05860 [Deltaproteobacteria bacterium]